MIKFAGFDILTPVKSDCFLFYFISKRLSQSHDSRHESLNTRFAFYWVVPILWPESRVWQVNPIDSVSFIFLVDFFFSILSFNIVFDWELEFMIYFGLIFIRLS